jgi:4,5-DOPA dioxygenase extradiol
MVPSLFLAHGSPMLALEDNDYTRFLARLGEEIRPRAVVVFTAHWESNMLAVTATDAEYDTIYDFYGFPEELYAVRYPARGSRTVALRVKEQCEKQGIPVRLDASRGLDHGTWTLLRRMYPEAGIPIVQASVNPYLPAAEQFAIGRALQGLGADEILVLGSGVTVHNLRRIHRGQTVPEPWAVEFDDWLIETVRHGDLDTLFRYDALAPHARQAVPTAEHFVPLLIAMGSAGTPVKAKVIHRSYDMGTLSYLCFRFDCAEEAAGRSAAK